MLNYTEMYYLVIIFLVLFTNNVQCKRIPECVENNTQETSELTETLLNSYETNVNESIEIEKTDKNRLNSWADHFQLNQVNLTATYRVQMMRHKDYNFGNNVNPKWRNCTRIYKRNIKRTELDYYEKEGECLKKVMVAGDEKRSAIAQMEKEIKKWRRSYRYLRNLCNRDNPNNKRGAGGCLVDYMERDHFSEVLKRLTSLKLRAMGELNMLLTDSAVNFEDCLKLSLSEYLSDVRSLMDILNWCYSGINNKVN